MDDQLTAVQAAKEMSASLDAVLKAIRRGVLPATRQPGGPSGERFIITRADLSVYLRDHRRPGHRRV